MAISPTPITVWVTAIMVAPSKTNRVSIRFQNVSATQTLYFVRQISLTVTNIPSATNYEFSLEPGSAVYEDNLANITSNSTAQFNCVSSAAAGSLAIYETTR